MITLCNPNRNHSAFSIEIVMKMIQYHFHTYTWIEMRFNNQPFRGRNFAFIQYACLKCKVNICNGLQKYHNTITDKMIITFIIKFLNLKISWKHGQDATVWNNWSFFCLAFCLFALENLKAEKQLVQYCQYLQNLDKTFYFRERFYIANFFTNHKMEENHTV